MFGFEKHIMRKVQKVYELIHSEGEVGGEEPSLFSCSATRRLLVPAVIQHIIYIPLILLVFVIPV